MVLLSYPFIRKRLISLAVNIALSAAGSFHGPMAMPHQDAARLRTLAIADLTPSSLSIACDAVFRGD